MEKKEKNDVISNPNHYKLDGLDIEVKDILKSVLGTVGFLGFYQGNIIKYILRAKKKNGLEDYKKARQYLDWLIEELDDDGNIDGQLTYLEDKDEMNRELPPEETQEFNELFKKMTHTALTMTPEEEERYRELADKKYGTVEEFRAEQMKNRANFYKLQEKLSKKVTK